MYVHGLGSVRGGEKSRALEAVCARRGWTFAAFDFRGHGGSTGSLRELRGSALLEDLGVIGDHLAARGVRRVCPVGSSMGGWAGAWFTLTHPDLIPACVLLAPALNFASGWWDRLSEAERRRWKETDRLRVRNEWLDAEIGYGLVEEAGRYPVEALAAGWGRPLLIFHGLRDDTIPFGLSLSFVERTAYPQVELRLFKDGDHRLQGYEHVVAEAAADFFGRHAAPPLSGG
jgi:pimeloyl-ACP methyl ester carboxylesterase